MLLHYPIEKASLGLVDRPLWVIGHLRRLPLLHFSHAAVHSSGAASPLSLLSYFLSSILLLSASSPVSSGTWRSLIVGARLLWTVQVEPFKLNRSSWTIGAPPLTEPPVLAHPVMFWHPLGYTSHSHTPSSWTCNWPLWNLHQSSPCCNYFYAIRFGSNPTRASRPRSSKLILSNSRGESCQSSWTAAQFSRMFWVDLAGLLHWCKLNILKQWPFHLKGKVLSLSNFFLGKHYPSILFERCIIGLLEATKNASRIFYQLAHLW